MDKAHPLTTPMVVRSLEVEKDPFRPRKQDDETLGPGVPYLSAIGALMYLANNTRPDIAFAVNLLARFSSDPTKRHWDGIKHIFRYLRGTIDLGLFFPNNSRSRLVGYADAGYMSDPHFGRSQTGYLFTYCDTSISWKSTKQTMAATSSNHAELLAIHEASRECIWLSMPISERKPKDALIWAFAKDGQYSVKSAYMLGKSCNFDQLHQVWVDIWGLDVSPKVMFV
ncbi:secreted RxLR effector protein 161-like [Apium graveolens]|uniref:secreted RxLR effector protein 161-like n=1 Tax=Apium graveolens TaxID=4045 RepID=UPI003D7BE11A